MSLQVDNHRRTFHSYFVQKIENMSFVVLFNFIIFSQYYQFVAEIRLFLQNYFYSIMRAGNKLSFFKGARSRMHVRAQASCSTRH